MATMLLALALLATAAHAVVVEVYQDGACTMPVATSFKYTAWAGVCNTAFTPDSGYAIGLDFCSPLGVTLSLFLAPSVGAAEVWGSAITCSPPANATVALAVNVCTQVRSCPACQDRYFKLVDTQCTAPVATLILQHDRGEDTPGGVQGCQAPRSANAGQRFQTREVLLGVCNNRTAALTPESVSNGGNCASSLSSCSRVDINSLSLQPVQTPEGLDVTTYFSDACSENVLPITWLSVPVQDRGSLFCRVQQQWGSGALQTYVRHGLRVYAPQPYVTLQSLSPTPAATHSPSPTLTPTPSQSLSPTPAATHPSPTLTPTPSLTPTAQPPERSGAASASPTPPAAAPAAAPASSAVTREEVIGISVAALVLLAALGLGLAVLYLKLPARPQEPPKELQPVEMVNAMHAFTRSRQGASA